MDKAHEDQLSHHLRYEHDVLRHAHAFLTEETFADERKDWFKRQAAIIAFWVSARSLIEFYEKEKAHNPSASRFTKSTFYPNFKLKKHDPEDKNYSEEFSDLVTMQITHIKLERVIDTNRKLGGYDLDRVKEALDRALKKFQAELNDESREVWNRPPPPPTLIVDGSLASASSLATTYTSTLDGRIVGHTGPAAPKAEE